MEVKKLKVAVVREELVAITNDFIIAIILNHFLELTNKLNDCDKMLEEERAIAEKCGSKINIEPKAGWIYTTYDKLLEETMINISESTLKRKIDWLVENEYIFTRANKARKRGSTKEYKVNLPKVINDVNEYLEFIQ